MFVQLHDHEINHAMLTLCMTRPSEGYLDALSRNITYSLQDYRQLGHRTFQALTYGG